MVSVKAMGDIAVGLNRSVALTEAIEPATTDQLRVQSSGVHPAGWRGRFHSIVSFLVVLTFVFLSLIFILAHGKVADPDIWWHLHNADYLIQHHKLPDADMFSFTVHGYPWMNHEWLAELPYYFGWRLLGLSGIEAVALAVLAVIFLGVLYLAYR